jgi:opacity protein-like surface antigen
MFKEILVASALLCCSVDVLANGGTIASVNEPLFNFYVGAAMGGFFSSSNINITALSDLDPNNLSHTPLLPEMVDFSSNRNLKKNNLKGSFYAGLGNFWANYYLGLEFLADIPKYNAETNINLSDFVIAGKFQKPGTAALNMQEKVTLTSPQFGLDVRPGVIIPNGALLYARIGLNYARLKINGITTGSGNGSVTLDNTYSVTLPSQATKNHVNLRVGGGFEKPISSKLALRLEYIFVDYGAISINNSITGLSQNSIPVLISDNSKAHLNSHSILLGLSYSLGSPYDYRKPVCLVHRNDGFYIGGGVGGSFTSGDDSINDDGTFTTATNTTKVPLTIMANLKKNSLTGELYTGIGHSWNHFYLGSEGFANISNYKSEGDTIGDLKEPGVGTQITISDFTTTNLSRWQYGLDLKPGFWVSDNTLLTAHVGINFAKMNINTVALNSGFGSAPLGTWFVNLPLSSEKRRASLRLGGGLEQNISQNLSLRLDYNHTNYGSVRVNANTSGFTTTHFIRVGIASDNKISVQNNSIMLGLTYYMKG